MVAKFVGLAFAALAIPMALSCGEPAAIAPKPRIPSKWVGTYEVSAEEYRNGVNQPDVVPITLTFVIGDIPHLFLDQNAIYGGRTGKGEVVDTVVTNSEEKIYFVYAYSEPFRDSSGRVYDDKYSHVDKRYVLYSNPATAENIIVRYESSLPTPDYSIPGDVIRRGTYLKTGSENHDCRTYEPPCEE